MDIDLNPKVSTKLRGGVGGSYSSWSPDELGMMKRSNIAAAKLALGKDAIALPHYSDSGKFALVLQGNGVAGVILPEKEEKLIGIRSGDAISLPCGAVTWWHNKEDAEVIVLFLGDTSKGDNPGYFTDYCLTESNGIFTGFSSELASLAWDADESTNDSVLTYSNPHLNLGAKPILLLLGFGFPSTCSLTPYSNNYIKLPNLKNDDRDGLVYNADEFEFKNGELVLLNADKLPLAADIGLCAGLVKLEGSATYIVKSNYITMHATYIVSGSGNVELVGVDGKTVLDASVTAGQLFIVPRLCGVSKISDPDGMSWFTIFPTPILPQPPVALPRHRATHRARREQRLARTRPCNCEGCTAVFPLSGLKAHIKAVHKAFKFICNHCGEGFKLESESEDHIC
ncbi:unnamed protein product [Linum tenue]|uniref:Cupin type-1 domain-containing protein n=1 Tax=Linum tenue TaxID=586396 RepID=A0AAV0MZX6_9ROSI|nr:unnamed protein product [Linum tenue]